MARRKVIIPKTPEGLPAYYFKTPQGPVDLSQKISPISKNLSPTGIISRNAIKGPGFYIRLDSHRIDLRWGVEERIDYPHEIHFDLEFGLSHVELYREGRVPTQGLLPTEVLLNHQYARRALFGSDLPGSSNLGFFPQMVEASKEFPIKERVYDALRDLSNLLLVNRLLIVKKGELIVPDYLLL